VLPHRTVSLAPAGEDVARAGVRFDLAGDILALEEIARCVFHRAARQIEGDCAVIMTVYTSRFFANDAQGAVCAGECGVCALVYYQAVVCAAYERSAAKRHLGIVHHHIFVECAIGDFSPVDGDGLVEHTAAYLGFSLGSRCYRAIEYAAADRATESRVAERHCAAEYAMANLAIAGHSAAEPGGGAAAALDDAFAGDAVVGFSIKHNCAAHRAATRVHRAVQAEGAAIGGRAALDRAAGHGECAVLDAHAHSAAVAGSLAAFDNTASHLERASTHGHTAAILRRATHDAAGIHGEPAAGCDMHSAAACAAGLMTHDIAAVHDDLAAAVADSYSADAAAGAAGDDTAEDGLRARASSLIPHPQAVGVGGELVGGIGVAVHDGHDPDGTTSDMNRILPLVKDVAVEVEDELAVIPDDYRHRHAGREDNIVRQLDHAHALIRHGRGQLRRIRHGDIQPAR